MPMVKKVVWECVDELLQHIMLNDLPFGGKAFVGLGDFRQVPSFVAARVQRPPSTIPFGPLTSGTNLRSFV